MMRVYLVRHGETEWNLDNNRYCGRTDVPLSGFGLEQAAKAATALRLVAFDAIYSSPLARAQTTATLIADAQAGEVTVDDRLIEIDFGRWEGLTRSEIERRDGPAWAAWVQNPDVVRAGGTGETGRDVVARAERFVADVLAAHPEGTVAVVGHNTFNRLYLAASLEAPLRNYRRLVHQNGGLSIVDVDVGGATWREINGTAHLA